jgi:hypothetical protein
MTPDELRDILTDQGLLRRDLATLTGRSLRQAQAWCLGESPVPLPVSTILRALQRGMLTLEFLAEQAKTTGEQAKTTGEVEVA